MHTYRSVTDHETVHAACTEPTDHASLTPITIHVIPQVTRSRTTAHASRRPPITFSPLSTRGGNVSGSPAEPPIGPHSMIDYTWRTVDFRPASAPGWRALFLDSPTGRHTREIAGWLIEEEIGPRPRYDDEARPTGDRRVRAAVPDEMDELRVASESSNFWCVLAPDEPEPSAADEAEQRELMAREREWRRARAAEPTG